MTNSINERRSIRKYQEGNVISCCFIIREKQIMVNKKGMVNYYGENNKFYDRS